MTDSIYSTILIRMLRVTQRLMVKAIVDVYLRNRTRNEETRKRTRLTEIALTFAKLKCQWTGHITRGFSSGDGVPKGTAWGDHRQENAGFAQRKTSRCVRSLGEGRL